MFGGDVPVYEDEKGAIGQIEDMGRDELLALVHDLIKNVGEVMPYLSRRFTLENASAEQVVKNAREAIVDATMDGYNYWEHHGRGHYGDDYDDAPDYDKVKEYFERLAKLGKVRELVKLCDLLIKRGTEQLKISDDEGEMICGMQECVEVVARTVYSSDMPDSEKLLWEYRRETGDEFNFLASGCDESLSYWSRKDIPAAAWSKVADAILKECKAGGDDLTRVWSHLSSALQNAGRGDEAVETAKKTAKTSEDYLRVVEVLHARGDVAEAMEWCRKGLSEGSQDCWQAERFKGWLKRFAEERGDWLAVAAYETATFMSCPGLDGFRRLEEVCRKAGAWRKVRAILLDCLSSGEQPLSKKDWPLPRPEYSDARLESCQCPMSELLCRIALHEKRVSDVARWFDVLAGMKTKSASLNAVWHNQELAFAVAEAVKREMPDDAIGVWKRIVDANCRSAGEHYYETITRALKAMKPTMAKRHGEKAWRDLVSGLRTEYKRRRNLAAMLDGLMADGRCAADTARSAT